MGKLGQARDMAQLTLLFPLALLLLTGLAVQLGLLQGPVEFFGSLLLLEANLFFSSPPLFFLFPLQNYRDRMAFEWGTHCLGDSVARQAELSGGERPAATILLLVLTQLKCDHHTW